jgi:hypothetical protein
MGVPDHTYRLENEKSGLALNYLENISLDVNSYFFDEEEKPWMVFDYILSYAFRYFIKRLMPCRIVNNTLYMEGNLTKETVPEGLYRIKPLLKNQVLIRWTLVEYQIWIVQV